MSFTSTSVHPNQTPEDMPKVTARNWGSYVAVSVGFTGSEVTFFVTQEQYETMRKGFPTVAKMKEA